MTTGRENPMEAATPRRRFAVFVHEPDGDMGDGLVVGAFYDAEAADRKAEAIVRNAESRGRYVECIVLPMSSGSMPARSVVTSVLAVGDVIA